MNAAAGDHHVHDFAAEENYGRWRGVLIPALKRVLEQVHPSLDARDDALEYIEKLCLRLLAMLCAKPSPHSVQDVEDRVQSTFPTPIDKWALKEAQEALEKGKKKSVLPVDKIHSLLQKELLQYKIDSAVSLFLVAVLEYISADILKLAGNYVKTLKHVEITYQDVQISMNVDKALMDMFYQDEGEPHHGVPDTSASVLAPSPSSAAASSLSYEEVVKELMTSERQYLRELHMVIRVFREEIVKLSADQRELDAIFSNIMDIYELTVTLLGSLEDVIEMAQDQMPYIGSCFEELAEAAEFDVYTRYAHDVTSPACRSALDGLLSRPEVQGALVTAGQGMQLALKYYLPALLIAPIRHCFSYLDHVKLLRGLSVSPEDRESLTQVEGLLTPLQIELAHCASNQVLHKSVLSSCNTRSRRQATLDKIHELEKIVEGWDLRDGGQCCNEFIREDVLMKVSSGRRLTERRAFLFDGLMILAKPNSRRQSSVHQAHPECRLKERLFIRRVEIVDHSTATDELKNAFEIAPRTEPSMIFCTKSADEKNVWMADLVMLNTRSMLDRILDSILSDIERKHPLRLPSPDVYKFAEPDSEDNIILEQRENGGVPLIRGATLYKLVERLTYHIYADPKFIRTFLTTYPSFCEPLELLDLLIERFSIPDPSQVFDQDGTGCDGDKMQKNFQREDWKRYRKEFCQPVQFRVLNVLRHWVDHRYSDFENDSALLEKLQIFLTSVNSKSMKKWVDVVLKILKRKKEPEGCGHRQIKFPFEQTPAPIEWHLSVNEEDFNILTLHPIEIGRQLTLIHFDLYKAIKPWEISVWAKKNKEVFCPNLLRMVNNSTAASRWFEKLIVETENFEERYAVVLRILDIFQVLLDLNNFHGAIAVVAAMMTASIHRLHHTVDNLPQKLKDLLSDWSLLDHCKSYNERLRSINPPCVPFLGNFLTTITLLEEGNADFLTGTSLINFFKRRRIADVTAEIQQYQNQPYCYSVEPRIRHWLEEGVSSVHAEMSDHDLAADLFNKSQRVEPKNCEKPPKFARRWPGLKLKSPGIKIKPRQQQQQAVASSQQTMRVPAENCRGGDDGAGAKSGDEFSVFAPVQLQSGTQNSPTLSPASPAPTPFLSWLPGHSRSPSTISEMSTASIRSASTVANIQPDDASLARHGPRRLVQQTAGVAAVPISPGSHSPGPHSPASPGPTVPAHPEPNSPRLAAASMAPPLPPRGIRRDSTEISSPQQALQDPDAPVLHPRNSLPPPLPPRTTRDQSGHHSPNAHGGLPSPPAPPPSAAMPVLRPTHVSELYLRRHSSAGTNPRPPPRPMANGPPSIPPQAPAVSPRTSETTAAGQTTPRLPPRPTVRSADMATGATMFQYPSTTTI